MGRLKFGLGERRAQQVQNGGDELGDFGVVIRVVLHQAQQFRGGRGLSLFGLHPGNAGETFQRHRQRSQRIRLCQGIPEVGPRGEQVFKSVVGMA